jgi:Xaa-Pro aminopeptidase
LQVVCESADAGGEVPMLEFETLTLVPFDVRMLDTAIMDSAEIDWLNVYHQRVSSTIGPLLSGSDLEWLTAATRPLEN